MSFKIRHLSQRHWIRQELNTNVENSIISPYNFSVVLRRYSQGHKLNRDDQSKFTRSVQGLQNTVCQQYIQLWLVCVVHILCRYEALQGHLIFFFGKSRLCKYKTRILSAVVSYCLPDTLVVYFEISIHKWSNGLCLLFPKGQINKVTSP